VILGAVAPQRAYVVAAGLHLVERALVHEDTVRDRSTTSADHNGNAPPGCDVTSVVAARRARVEKR